MLLRSFVLMLCRFLLHDLQVGLMLNGCAIDNVLPAMAMHADLLKGDIIVKVDNHAATTETVHRQLIGDDIPGTTVNLTVRRGHTERSAQLVRMANNDIADMRRVFEIFTNLKSRFPVISGEVDEVVTIWSEVVSGEALYRAQVANSMQRLDREGSELLHELRTALDEQERNNILVREAFEDARAVENRLTDVKKQLIHFGEEVRDQLSSQGTTLREVTRERDALKDSVVDARVQHQNNKSQLESLREEGTAVKDRLRVAIEERDKALLDLNKVQGHNEELRALVAMDAEKLRELTAGLDKAKGENERCKGQLMEVRDTCDAMTEQIAEMQHERRAMKSEVESTKGLMEELRKQLGAKKDDLETLHTDHEMRGEELNRTLGSLQALRDELEQTKAAMKRLDLEKQESVAEVERTQGQLLEIRRMLSERANRLQEAEIEEEKARYEVESANGVISELRSALADKEQQMEDLLADVGKARAYKAEFKMLTDEVAKQRAKFTELGNELTSCKHALEREALAKTNALTEKEGLWQVTRIRIHTCWPFTQNAALAETS
jgi:chromosome segregation ATPase